MQNEITETAIRIAHTLGETDSNVIARLTTIVQLLGVDKAQATLDKATAIYNGRGVMTKDGTRKKTYGGVFFFVARQYKAVNELWRTGRNRSPTNLL